MVEKYSHSKMSAFDQCSYKYKLRYVDKVRAELGKSIEAFMGSMVHDTLEKHYELAQQSKILTEEELLEVYNEYWKRNWSEDIRIIKEEFNAENYRQTGERCLKNYYARNAPFDVITLGLEDFFLMYLPSGNQINGLIDRLEKVEDGHIAIHDYKTNKRAPTQAQADVDKQLGLYALAMRRKYPTYKKFDLIWHYVAVDEVIKSNRTDEELDKLIIDTEERITKIEAAVKGQNFETKKGVLCGWCEYRKQCPEFSHLYQLEDDREKLQITNITAQEASELVDELEQLNLKNNNNQEQIDGIKAKLIEYKKEAGVERIYGTEKEIGFSEYTAYLMPAKGSKDRDELEGLLKRLDLWSNVTEFSTHKLRKMLKEGELSEDDKDVILAFVEQEEKWRLNLKNRDLSSTIDILNVD